MKSILIALILSLSSFNALSYDEVGSKYLILAYDDSVDSQNYSDFSSSSLSQHEREEIEYEELLDDARSRLKDKRSRGEIKGTISDRMVEDYVNDWDSDF